MDKWSKRNQWALAIGLWAVAIPLWQWTHQPTLAEARTPATMTVEQVIALHRSDSSPSMRHRHTFADGTIRESMCFKLYEQAPSGSYRYDRLKCYHFRNGHVEDTSEHLDRNLE